MLGKIFGAVLVLIISTTSPVCLTPIEISQEQFGVYDVSEGIIVYKAFDESGKIEVFTKNVDTNEEKKISKNGAKKWTPFICNNYVLWTQRVGRNYEMVLYNMKSEETEVIAENTFNFSIRPALTDKWIVWIERKLEENDMLAYNLETKEKISLIEDKTIMVGKPVVVGDNAFYVYSGKSDCEETERVFHLNSFNLMTGETELVHTGLGSQVNMHGQGDWVVWNEKIDMNSFKLFLYQISEKKTIQVETSDHLPIDLAMCGETVVYIASTDSSEFSAIYMLNVPDENPTPKVIYSSDSQKFFPECGDNVVLWHDIIEPGGRNKIKGIVISTGDVFSVSDSPKSQYLSFFKDGIIDWVEGQPEDGRVEKIYKLSVR
ncbi:MAG TPA: hypothetical protein PKV16_04445 [Caldisericia bacterium]|nr:hypothetical protein [Caldisericia bacterium]HPF48559.1 hypothetical protein [Caldisericia bacterium]HPI83781.1 hypothetical protein [Caldisericia bacterium]HPQ93014.1 hypothetical protein [Caldisericia bacterium]HRV75153.1 hypothetical protein [Caldisericia bacterium]